MTTKKPTGSKSASQEQSVAATPSPEEVLARYMDAVKTLELMRQQLESQGYKLEAPPAQAAMVKDAIPSPELLAAKKALPEVPEPAPDKLQQAKPGEAVGGTYRPWTKMDLRGQEKYNLVPTWIPGAVHPIKDENGKFHIFLSVNGITASLILWEPQEVSGMFYHAYRDIEKAWHDSEDFRTKGPVEAPWVSGGLHGANTWSYQPEAPSAWLNIDGGYYKPGDQMPLEEIAPQ